MKNISRSFLIILSILLITSCEENDFIQQNQLIDEQGITIRLEWELINATVDPTEVDLDLLVTANGSLVEQSTSSFLFEKVSLSSSLPNQIYDVTVRYVDGDFDVRYFITVEGQSSFEQVSINDELASSFQGNSITPIKIFKNGSTFELN